MLWLSFYGYFVGFRELAALLLAVLVHELGHTMFIYLQNGKIERVRMESFGFRIDAAEAKNAVEGVFRCLAGPLAGGILHFILKNNPSALLRQCAEFSRRLTCFNLLPFSFLDGGGAIKALLQNRFPQTAERKMKCLNALTALFCLLALLLHQFVRKS